jgi:hypothetical protein
MILSKQDRDLFLKLSKEKKVFLEGNIAKVIKASEGDNEFDEYLKFCIKRDNDSRRKRLDVTKQVQSQNKTLESVNSKNIKLMEELKSSLEESLKLKNDAERAKLEAESAKNDALQDLDVLQKKTQTELIGTIVKIALWVIIGVGLITSGLYLTVLIIGGDSNIIESTWSNLFGILLTNSFSIIGTIMGVKYATETKN